MDPTDLPTATDDDAVGALDELRRLVQFVRLSSHAAEKDVGISGAQLFVLRELAAAPGLSIRQLTERTLTDQSSVSVVVSRLVAAGLISRRKDPDDARRTLLRPTARGRALLDRAPEPYQARLITALQGLSRTRLRQLRTTLALLTRSLDADVGAAPLFFEEPPTRKKSPRES